ncbi:MAG: tRNA (guanosine(46)-N7)-methyltransferase TrmB [Syntrophobacterales bacterium]|nr:tRNA (guanosine(46)-N7)-methyltransferase TrmB [Syntrophobacterales bacterium]
MKARYLSLEPLVNWRVEKHPINWQSLFNYKAPLVVEVGFGNGEYLIKRAKEHPELNFVGIDREWQSVWRTLRAIKIQQISNVKILKADARWVFGRLFAPESIQEVYALFPCPWPKRHHERYRLFSRRFLLRLNSRLVMDGVVWIVTDDESYFKWILDQAPNAGFLVSWETIGPGFFTKYENKWKKAGKNRFYKLTLTKEIHHLLGEPEELGLRTYRIKDFSPDLFSPKSMREDVVVEFKDFLYDPARKRAVLRAVVIEDEFLQDFWIEIRYTGEDWIIRPYEGCGWIPTVGTQKALDLVWESVEGSLE